MFAQLSYKEPLLASSAVLVAFDALLGRPNDEETPGLCFVLSLTGVTAGFVTAQAIGSVDGTNYYSLGSTMVTAALGGDGLAYLPMVSSIPPYVGVRLTPAGGFDGYVAIDTYSGGRIGTEVPGQS